MEIAARSHTDALQLPQTVTYLAIPMSALLMLIHWFRLITEAAWPTVALKIGIAAGFFWVVYLPLGQYVQLAGVSGLRCPGVGVLRAPRDRRAGGLCARAGRATYVSIFGRAIQHGRTPDFIRHRDTRVPRDSAADLVGQPHESRPAWRSTSSISRRSSSGGSAAVSAPRMSWRVICSATSRVPSSPTRRRSASLMIPEMKRRGYRADFCAALQGASGHTRLSRPVFDHAADVFDRRSTRPSAEWPPRPFFRASCWP